MKRTIYTISTLILSVLCMAGCVTTDDAARSGDVPASWKAIEIEPLRPFEIQNPKRIELDNGLVIFLQEDRELPLIRGVAVVRGGEREVPAAKTGFIGVYGQAWRTGGTDSRTGDELDELLEARAAIVETGGDIDSTTISWDSLAEDSDFVLDIVTDLIRNPAFREEKIELAKKQINTGIARRNDDPSGIASREAGRLAYGSDSPYARLTEYDTVAAVTRDDLVAWHRRYVHPNNMIIGVTGDFDSAAMEAKIRERFQAVPAVPEATVPEIAIQPADPGVYLIRKEDVTQSNIRLVHPGITRDNPDYYAIRMMNEIFGGGFSARLFSRIRSDQGLAYAVGGGVGAAYDHPGMFSISMGTKSGSTLQAIKALYGEIEDLQAGPIEDLELVRARESILNSFIFSIDSKEEILREKIALEFYGYPLDLIDRFQDEIRAVTLEDVQRVAREYIHKDELAVLVVGRPEDFDGDLSELGEVQELDITIPEPGSLTQTAIVGNQGGRELLDLVLRGLGGADAVNDVEAMSRKGTATVNTPQGQMAIDIESLEVYPSSIRQVLTTPMGKMTMVATPEAGFMATPMGAQPLPGSQKEEMLRNLQKTPVFIAQQADESGYVFADVGTEEVDAVQARVLDIDAAGTRIRWLVHPETGNILRSESGGTVSNYSDFRKSDGIVQPHRIVVLENGQETSTIEIDSFEVNPDVPAGAFDQPSQ